MFYKKRPEIVEAIQWVGTNVDEIKEFVGEKLVCETTCLNIYRVPKYTLFIHTYEYDVLIRLGDYVVKYPDGEFRPYRPKEFKQIYEAMNGGNK